MRPRVGELAARGLWHLHPARPEPAYRRLVETQWLSPEEIEQLQISALNDLLAAAVAIPFYRDRLRTASLEPGSVRSLSDLGAIPALERSELQTHGVEGLSGSRRFGVRRVGSGSTGRPAEVLWAPDMMAWADATERRSKDWLGVRYGERNVYVRARPPGARAWAEMRLRARLKNNQLVSAASLSDPQERSALVGRLVRTPPVVIGGNASCLYGLALAVLDDGRTPRFRICLSSGNHLHDHYRRAMEEAFRCPVYDRYGTVEAGLIAHPCPEAGSLHIAAEGLLVETVRPDGTRATPGEIGEVLVTTLCNPGMPLIRYRIGDLAVLGAHSCTCGRGLPVLEQLVGRTNDLVVTADGERVVPEAVSRLAFTSEYESVLEFQVLQRADLRLEVKVVQRDEPSPAECRRRIARALDELIGIPGATRVERVDSIPLTGAGKLRHVVSEATAGASAPTVAGSR